MDMKRKSGIDLSQLVLKDRVNGSVYTDPDVFDLEMELIFEQGWVFVAHESEIPKAGDYKSTYIGRQPVIVSRHEDGGIYVMYNRCTHRGSVVCMDETGNSNHFRCVYHGWTFRNDGTLLGVPFRDAYPPDFDFKGLGLMRLPRVEMYRGFVFASMNPAVESLEENLGPAKMLIDNIVDRAPDGKLELRSGAQKYEFKGNWKLQVENVLDLYHPTFIHASTAFEDGRQFKRQTGAGEGNLFDFSDEKVSFFDQATSHSLPNGHGYIRFPNQAPELNEVGQRYVEKLKKTLGAEKADQLLQTRIHNALIYPNLCLQETSSHIRVIRPVSVNHTEIYVYPIRLVGAPDEMYESVLRYITVTHSPSSFIQTDDTEGFRRCQTGLQATGPKWVFWARGIHREYSGELPGEIVGKGTDEVPQRGQFRRWTQLMNAND